MIDITEIWKDVVDYEGIYEVSNYANIRTHINKTTSNKRFKVRKWKQRVLKQKVSKDNNHRVNLWKDGVNTTWLVHRLVAIAFIPNPDNLATVNHKNGDRNINYVYNLEWMSLADNIRHGFANQLIGTNKITIITSLDNGDSHVFNSMSLASKFMGYCVGYISDKMKKNKFQNSLWKWELEEKEG